MSLRYYVSFWLKAPGRWLDAQSNKALCECLRLEIWTQFPYELKILPNQPPNNLTFHIPYFTNNFTFFDKAHFHLIASLTMVTFVLEAALVIGTPGGICWSAEQWVN